jgi:protein TonB
MGYRWRKAVIFSVSLHLIFWGVAGYVSAHRQSPPPVKEQIVELVDLPTEPTKEPPEEQPAIQPSPPRPEPEEAPVPETPSPPLAVSDSDEEKIIEKVVQTSVNGKDTEEPVVVSNKAKPKARTMGTPPVVLSRAYPSPEEQGDFKGTVVLKVQILENGIPGKIEIAVTSGTRQINEAAIAAAKKWRFKPALDHEGNPMVCTTIMSIPFNKK